MWAFLDFVARLILLGGVALVWFWLRSIVHEPSARGCVCCGYPLKAFEIATCDRCLDPELSNVCEICAGGRSVPNSGAWCEDLQGHARIAARKNSAVSNA